MHKTFLRIAAFTGMLSVALGAFAAHALKDMISEHAIATFETGVRYQFYHAFALMATGILYKDFQSRSMVWAGRLFFAGIILFSGSLYALSVLQAMVSPQFKWIGIITPFGGLCFIAGWLLLFISFINQKK